MVEPFRSKEETPKAGDGAPKGEQQRNVSSPRSGGAKGVEKLPGTSWLRLGTQRPGRYGGRNSGEDRVTWPCEKTDGDDCTNTGSKGLVEDSTANVPCVLDFS